MIKPNLKNLIGNADKKSYGKWVLNRILNFVIPFNAPHKLKIIAATEGKVKVLLPYIRSNRNHVKSLHACALAILCEYTTGLTILSLISETDYRIILKNISVQYFYQGVTDVTASFEIDKKLLQEKIIMPLQTHDAVLHEFEIKVYDKNNKHICTGLINWQIKNWKHVKATINK